MKVLIIGSGAREHAIGQKISEKQGRKLYFIPGNGGTESLGTNVDIAADDIYSIRDFAKENFIDLTIVGPEQPLSLGIVDVFQEENLKIFGPDKFSSQLETSKSFAKKFMNKYNIPTASYEEFTDYKKALKYLEGISYPTVVKADGLAQGKGVLICKDIDEAKEAVKNIMVDKIFGTQGEKIIIEEFLEGKEVSLLCFTDSKTIVPMETASDYKKAYDNDKGKNTGGMGCISPSVYYKEGSCKDIVENTIKGIKNENMNVKGIVYIGLIMTEDGPKVLEYNMRFGDPETQVLLPRLKNDLVEIIENILLENLSNVDISWSDKKAITTVIAAKGYPEKPVKGNKIDIKDRVKDAIIYHYSTLKDKDKYISNSGRVLCVTSLGDSLNEARDTVYSQIEKIDFPESFYRSDIGVF